MSEEKLIFINKSSRSLYETYEMAFDCYFQLWSEECKNFAATCEDLVFNVRTNKKSVTIYIFDNEKKDKK